MPAGQAKLLDTPFEQFTFRCWPTTRHDCAGATCVASVKRVSPGYYAISMELDRFLNLLAATIGAMGSAYVLKGIAGLSPQLIERLSRSHWDFSSAQVNALTAQKAEALIGIALVLTAFAIAVLNLAGIPSGVLLFESRVAGVGIIAAVVVLAWPILHFAAKLIQARQKRTVNFIIVKSGIQESLNIGHLSPAYVPNLRLFAVTLLGMPIDEGEAPRELFHRLAARVGLTIPANFNFSEVEKVTERC